MKRRLDALFGVPLVAFFALFAKKRETSALRKILIIKLAAAGDTILLSNELERFRRAHPEAQVHWLVSPINVEIAQMISGVDKFILWRQGLAELPSLVRQLRAEKYDAV